MFYASFVHIVQAKLGQANAGDNEVKIMLKHAPSGFQPATSNKKSSTLPLWTVVPAPHLHYNTGKLTIHNTRIHDVFPWTKMFIHVYSSMDSMFRDSRGYEIPTVYVYV